MIFMTVFDFDEGSEYYSKLSLMSYGDLLGETVAHCMKEGPDDRIISGLTQIKTMVGLFRENAIMGMPDFFNYLMKHSSEGLDLIRGWVDISGEWDGERSYDTSQKEYEFIVLRFGKRHSTRGTRDRR